MTTRRYPIIAVVGETKRAFLVRVPHKTKPVRVPKRNTVFETNPDNTQAVLVDDRVAEFIGLVDEVSL